MVSPGESWVPARVCLLGTEVVDQGDPVVSWKHLSELVARSIVAVPVGLGGRLPAL